LTEQIRRSFRTAIRELSDWRAVPSARAPRLTNHRASIFWQG
jgi:hypothetical protein